MQSLFRRLRSAKRFAPRFQSGADKLFAVPRLRVRGLKEGCLIAAIGLSSALCFAIFLLSGIEDLRNPVYSRDLDHAMYFAGRLLQGELLYEKEYYDKLPIYPFLFALPVWLNNVKVFIFANIALASLAGLLIYTVLCSILSYWDKTAGQDKLLVQAVAIWGASLYLALLSSAAGSLTLNNTTSTALFIASLAALVFANMNSAVRLYLFFGSALMSAIAISIRPYLVIQAVVISGLVLIGFESLSLPHSYSFSEDKSRNRKSDSAYGNSRFINYFTWLSMLVVVGLFINALPYILEGRLVNLLDGIRYNSQDLYSMQPANVIYGTVKSLNRIYACCLVFSLAITVYSFWHEYLLPHFSQQQRAGNGLKNRRCSRKDQSLMLFYCSVILPSTMMMLIIRQHFWPHYLQLFAPLLAISCALSLFYGLNILEGVRVQKRPIKRILIWIYMAIFIGFCGRWALSKRYAFYPLNSKSNDFDLISEISRYFRYTNNEFGDFLAPYSMKAHWYFNQSRHGFPHTANISAARDGLLLNYRHQGLIYLPNTLSLVCSAINESGPSLLFFAHKHDALTSCLVDIDSHYVIDSYDPVFAKDFTVLVRK
jgi:hypothetical protein